MAIALTLQSPSNVNIPTQGRNEGVVITINNPLVSYCEQIWNAARMAKEYNGVVNEMLIAKRQRQHQYDPGQLQIMKGSTIYMGLADFLCRKIVAWLEDIYLSQADRSWALEPSPIPELPIDFEPLIGQKINEFLGQFAQQGQQPPPDYLVRSYEQELRKQILEDLISQAKVATEAMQEQIEDQLLEGNFYTELMKFFDDLCTYPAAIINGPIVTQEPDYTFKKSSATGKWEYTIEKQIKLKFKRVNPQLFFPVNGATSAQNDSVEITRMTLRELHNMRGTPGTNTDEIDRVIQKHTTGGLVNWISGANFSLIDQALESSYFHNLESQFDVMKINADLPGYLIQDYDLPTKIIPNELYSVEVYRAGNHIIKVMLNRDPTGHKPYYSTSFYKSSDSIWGKSPCFIIRGFEALANGAIRAISNNMALASGPQVTIDIDAFAGGTELSTLEPWKYWQYHGTYTQNRQPINFHQPNMYADQLIKVLDYITSLAELFLGIPKLLSGEDNLSGPGRTASGLSILINQANRFFKQCVNNIDNDVIEPIIRNMYYFNMMFLTNESIKVGDAKPRARGAIELGIREATQLRMQEFLQTTMNPVDTQIMGPEGRRELLRQTAKGLDMDVDKIVPPGQNSMPFDMQNGLMSMMPQQQGQQTGQVLQFPQQQSGQMSNGQLGNTQLPALAQPTQPTQAPNQFANRKVA